MVIRMKKKQLTAYSLIATDNRLQKFAKQPKCSKTRGELINVISTICIKFPRIPPFPSFSQLNLPNRFGNQKPKITFPRIPLFPSHLAYIIHGN